MTLIEQPCEVLSWPFTDLECESQVVQITCLDYTFSLWSDWDSHTARLNSRTHGLTTTAGRFKIFMWLELLDNRIANLIWISDKQWVFLVWPIKSLRETKKLVEYIYTLEEISVGVVISKNTLFIWDSHLIVHPMFSFARSGNSVSGSGFQAVGPPSPDFWLQVHALLSRGHILSSLKCSPLFSLWLENGLSTLVPSS